MSSDESADATTREKMAAYSGLMYQTGIAVELVKDGQGYLWATGRGDGKIIMVTDDDRTARLMSPGEFGRELYRSDSAIVMGAREIFDSEEVRG